MVRDLTLPTSITGQADVARLARELENFDEELQRSQLQARSASKSGTKVQPQSFEPSKLLKTLAEVNEYDLQVVTQRAQLMSSLKDILDVAPSVTLSFASEPTGTFTSKMVEWFRTSIHPQTLLRISLQPNITAGFTLRTPGKVYDFSLESKFKDQRGLLMEQIKASKPAVETVAVTAAPAAAEAPHE